jgi:phytoene/squalene synthetase
LIQLVDADAQSSIAMIYQLYYQLLKKIEAREYDVFGPKISLSTREKLLYVTPLLWRRRAR